MNKGKETEKLDAALSWAMGISVALLGLSSAVLSIAALADLALPALAARVFGAISLLALPVLVYSAVRRALRRRQPEPPARTALTKGVRRAKKKKRRK